MKLIVFLLGILLFSTQVDFYDIDLVETSIVLEVEENNTVLEEFISLDDNFRDKSSEIPNQLEKFKPYLLSFDQTHPDQDIDPPDYLS
ncbi:hypothetical protein [Psychroflexus tropicus]|uniref:hypothetical protein n=1 Tax=Psychroflexus tropicus TaxID=197345 RepID=UPI00036FDC87|nr:hypothetical protein [Psychroflexus tropicus]